MARVFTDAQRDADSDGVRLTGAGGACCAGGDIAWMQRGIGDPADFERTGREGKDILFSQLELEKPLICALTGHATGLGASLALVCDVVIAAGGALQAIRWTKVTVNLPLKALVHAHFDAGLAHELLSNRSADHAEAVAAFRERRPPRFSGR